MPGQELNDAPAAAAASIPQQSVSTAATTTQANTVSTDSNASQGSSAASSASYNHEVSAPVSAAPIPLAAGALINARPGSMVRVPETIANGSKYLKRFSCEFMR